MKRLTPIVRRSSMIFTVLAFGVAVVIPAIMPADKVVAGILSSRKITLSSSEAGGVSTDANGTAVVAGAGGNGAQARHNYAYTLATAGNVGSMLFQYCTTPFVGTACTTPTGMDASTVAAVAASSGFNATEAFAIDTATSVTTGGYFTSSACASRAHCITVKRVTAQTETATAKTIDFGQAGGWIKNPTAVGTFYVRVVTFSDTAYTTQVDDGAVAASINEDIDITAKVQEKLNFSVSASTVAAGASCTMLSGTGAITLGDATNGVLDPATAYDKHSYFRLNTNSGSGTTVQYTGDTLKTSAAVAIASAGTVANGFQSTVGSEQFGLAINSADTNYSFTNLTRSDPYDDGAGTITNLGTARFAHVTSSTATPVTVASSTGSVTCDTGAVRYIANISTTTRPGIYRTTIGYIATPTY